MPLLRFNLGVEAGQLLILMVCLASCDAFEGRQASPSGNNRYLCAPSPEPWPWAWPFSACHFNGVNCDHDARIDAGPDSIVPMGLESLVGGQLPLPAHLFCLRERSDRALRSVEGRMVGSQAHRTLPSVERTGLRPRSIGRWGKRF